MLSGFSKRSKSTPRHVGRGIATIELAAIVTVSLVMVALAGSAYRTYTVRREVRAALLAVTPVQDLVMDAFQRTGLPPVSSSDVPTLESHVPKDLSVETLMIERGRIVIHFGADADAGLRGRSLAVAPFEAMDGTVAWLCGDREPDVGLYALGFFGGTLPPPQLLNAVDQRYLPPECR